MRRKLRWPSLAVSVLLASGLASPLPVRAQSAGPEADPGVDPANEPYEKPAVPDPPTNEERLPVIDLSELPGLWPEDVVEAYPGIRDPVSPDDAIEGASPLPTRGSATTDVFGIGEGSAEHLALIGVEPKNDLGTDGAWSEREISLDPVAGGWSWTDLAGVRFTFPVLLSAATPVLIETSGGSISLAPTSALPGGVSSAAVVQGASVTYPGAVDGNDLVYTATPLGVREQIILEKAPTDSTFRFTVAPKGLTLIPNPYGGLDVTGEDGEQVGTIPVAVADDASADVASSPATYELTALADDTIELALVFDPEFFGSATYPVVIDPVYNHQLSPHRDGYVQQSTPSTNYESNVNLKVGSGLRSFLRFDTSNIAQADRIVYDALSLPPFTGHMSTMT